MNRQDLLKIAKPILFNTEMVRAILDGRKTVTRRLANINTEMECHGENDFSHKFEYDGFSGFICHKCGFGVMPPHSRYPVGTSAFRPRYNVGDILYVRETWQEKKMLATAYFYKADEETNLLFEKVLGKWHPSIHMPKEAARIFLRVTGVRVERLQDITAEQIKTEGLSSMCAFTEDMEISQKEFANLWNSTIKKSGLDKYGWNANPFVWVYEIQKVDVNDDR